MSRPFDPSSHADTATASRDAPLVSVFPVDRPTARLAARLRTQADSIVDDVVRTITTRVGGYVAGEVPRDDLWFSVKANVMMLLQILAEDRELRSDEIADRAALGARRARQQLPVTQLIQAFQVGYIEVWRVLTDATRAEGQAAIDDLIEVAGHFWAMMHQVSASVAEAYHTTSRERGGEVRRRALGLFDLLHDLPDTLVDARDVAHSLGLDPESPFIAVVRPPRLEDDPLQLREDGIVLIERQDVSVLLTNEGRMGKLDPADGPVGVGTVRTGLDGALQSIRDAQQAYDAARTLGRPIVRFTEDWLDCILTPELRRLAPLVEEAVIALRADEYTAETVASYLAHDGRLSTAGDAIHVHANTVSYRIDKFARACGIDPRTTAGRLLASLALLQAEAAEVLSPS